MGFGQVWARGRQDRAEGIARRKRGKEVLTYSRFMVDKENKRSWLLRF
jgi:hypothetical protein